MCQAPPEKRLWCVQVSLKPDVQHKIPSNRLRPYSIVFFSSVWPPIHQFQGQHGKVKLQGIRRNTDPVVQHAVWFGDDATIISQPSLPRKLWKLGFNDTFMVWSIGRSKVIWKTIPKKPRNFVGFRFAAKCFLQQVAWRTALLCKLDWTQGCPSVPWRLQPTVTPV